MIKIYSYFTVFYVTIFFFKTPKILLQKNILGILFVFLAFFRQFLKWKSRTKIELGFFLQNILHWYENLKFQNIIFLKEFQNVDIKLHLNFWEFCFHKSCTDISKFQFKKKIIFWNFKFSSYVFWDIFCRLTTTSKSEFSGQFF